MYMCSCMARGVTHSKRSIACPRCPPQVSAKAQAAAESAEREAASLGAQLSHANTTIDRERERASEQIAATMRQVGLPPGTRCLMGPVPRTTRLMSNRLVSSLRIERVTWDAGGGRPRPGGGGGGRVNGRAGRGGLRSPGRGAG